MQKSKKAHNACYVVGDKVHLCGGSEVWVVEKILYFISSRDGEFVCILRRGDFRETAHSSVITRV